MNPNLNIYRSPHPPGVTPSGYQPTWEDGHEVGTGWRDCNGRYQAIKDYLVREGWKTLSCKDEPFTVLEIGAYNGYFCRRLHDDFRAECTAVDNNPRLEEAPGVKVIPHLLNPDQIRELGHFDVTLCLSVLHHYLNWYDYLGALLDSADVVFIETANPKENLGIHRPYAIGAHQELGKIGTVIAQTAPMYGNQLRPLWVVDRRMMKSDEEKVAILTTAFNAITPPLGDALVFEAGKDYGALASGILQVLDTFGWDLSYDPSKTVKNLRQIIATAEPLSSPTVEPRRPEQVSE